MSDGGGSEPPDDHDGRGLHQLPKERLSKIFAANPSLGHSKTLGPRSPVNERQLLAAVERRGFSDIIAKINVGWLPQPVEVNTEELLDCLEGSISQDVFCIGVSSVCQYPEEDIPRLQQHVFLARTELLGLMYLEYSKTVGSKRGTNGEAHSAGLDAAYKSVGKRSHITGGNLFASSVAIFPLGEEGCLWSVVLVLGLEKVKEAVATGEEGHLVDVYLCTPAGDGRGTLFFNLIRDLAWKFIEQRFEAENNEAELDQRHVKPEYTTLIMPNPPKDVDGGALMMKLVKMAVDNPGEFRNFSPDDHLGSDWYELPLGAKMKWLRPISDLRLKIIHSILEAMREHFARGADVGPVAEFPSTSRRGAPSSRSATTEAGREDTPASVGGRRTTSRRRATSVSRRATRTSAGGRLAPSGRSATTEADRGGEEPLFGRRSAVTLAEAETLGPQVPQELGCDESVDEDVEVDEMNEEEDEMEIQREWAESGVFVDGSGVPDGEPLPGESVESPVRSGGDAGSDPFIRVGISDFVRTGLGMGPEWTGDRRGVKQAFVPTRRLDLDLSSSDVSSENRSLIISVDLDALRMCCTLPAVASTINSTAAILLLKHPVLTTGMIKGGMFSFRLDGGSTEVKAQNVPNIRIGTVKGDHRLGDIAINLLFTYSWYDLSDSERRRDVFRAASAKQLDVYLRALSSTFNQLQDLADFLHLFNGVAPTVGQLRLAQRGEVLALPLEGEARNIFFDTLLSQLRVASGLGDESAPEGRTDFLLVLKSIGQKHMFRQHIYKAGEAEGEYGPLLEWESRREMEEALGSGVGSPRPESSLADDRLGSFADGLSHAVSTLLNCEAAACSLSLDIGLEVQASAPGDSKRLVLIPRIEWWGGDGRGASYRSSADPSCRGRLGDKRMDKIDRYSCLGTDQGGSLSGRSSSGGCSVLELSTDEDGDVAYIDSGATRQAIKVYSPSIYHYNHSSAGPVIANLLRNSPCTSLVEMIRISGLGGGRVASKRFKAVSNKLQEVERLGSTVLSGLGRRSGSMRVEVSYSVPTGDALRRAVLAVARDSFREVLGYDDRGWDVLSGSFFAVPAEDVALLAKAGFDRSVAAIRTGLDGEGDNFRHALPSGLLPSVGELLLQLEGKVFRRVVVGRMLLEGLRQFGYVGLSEEHLEALSVAGGDSSTGSSLPPGLLIGCGGGRRKEGFVPGVRTLLRDYGLSIPRVGDSAHLLADDGKELQKLLRKIVELFLREIQRLLRRNKMLPVAEGPTDPLWRPSMRGLKDANDALDGIEDSKRRFQVKGTRSTPAGVHLRKVMAPIVGKTVDRLPGPAGTVFGSLANVLSGGAMSSENITRWLELLLEAVYAEDEGLVLVPEAHATRIFRTMGCFVKCDFSDAEATVGNFKAKYADVDLSGGVGDVTGELLRCFCKVFVFPAEYSFSPAPPSRSRASVSGTHPREATAASSGGGRGYDPNNPWYKIHFHGSGVHTIGHPVVLLALCLGVDHQSSILKVYTAKERTDVTGRTDATKRRFTRYKDVVMETLAHINFGGLGRRVLDSTSLYSTAFEGASGVVKEPIPYVRYGITTGQLLAAACAVLGGASSPSGNELASEVLRSRIEVENGLDAAEAFLGATRNANANITRAVYPCKKNDKTPESVFRSWCALRRGSDIQRGKSMEQSVERSRRAARRTSPEDLGPFSSARTSRGDSDLDGQEPASGEQDLSGRDNDNPDVYAEYGALEDNAEVEREAGDDFVEDEHTFYPAGAEHDVAGMALEHCEALVQDEWIVDAVSVEHERGANQCTAGDDDIGGWDGFDPAGAEHERAGPQFEDVGNNSEDGGGPGPTGAEYPHTPHAGLDVTLGEDDMGGGSISARVDAEHDRAGLNSTRIDDGMEVGMEVGNLTEPACVEREQFGQDFKHGDGHAVLGGFGEDRGDIAEDTDAIGGEYWTNYVLESKETMPGLIEHRVVKRSKTGVVLDGGTGTVRPSATADGDGMDLDSCSGERGDQGATEARGEVVLDKDRDQREEVRTDADQMLSEFEMLQESQCSIFKANQSVYLVVRSFRVNGQEWFGNFSREGLSGSHISKKVAALRCTERRPNSVVKSVDQLVREGCTLDPTGREIISCLMGVLVRASILTGPDNKKRYHPGERLQRLFA